MTPPGTPPPSAVRADPMATPPAKWWGGYLAEGNPPKRRFVLRWGRILAALTALGVAGYLALATALWGYYAIDRKIPGVNWIDVAVLPRFSRVQDAIGAAHFQKARGLWEKKDYVQAIFTARAAVVKAPKNLEARLFLAGCWREVGRPEEAVRTLENGIEFDAQDPRLQAALVQTCLETERYQDLLKALREDFPARGVRLTDGSNRGFQLAELRAVLETADAGEAERIAAHDVGLAEVPAAAPLLSRIDWELGRHEAAFARLRLARERAPGDPSIQDAYVDTASRLGRIDEAHAAARQFLTAFPGLLAAQLRFIEVYGSRQGSDKAPWTAACMQFLAQYRRQPAALGQLGSLAASKGWTDLAFLLYENSLQENLTGFPFSIYYAGSLVKAGDLAGADGVWHELSIRNGPQLAAASYIAAMVAWGSGRQSDALQIIDQLRGQTVNDPHRKRVLEEVFRTFGFAQLADLLAKPK
jgi:Flp pilus assembly protein TadD